MPIVRMAATVSWRGRKGKVKPKSAVGEDQEAGVDRLGHVEATEPVDVAGDPAALGDRLRQHRELRPRAGRCRRSPLVIWLPEPIATASRACFSAGTSLTPSPIIAVNRPESDERADQRLLLLGRDPAEDRVLLGDLGELVGVVGQVGPSTTPASVGTPSAWATAVTVSRASPEISFRSTSCSRMNSIVSAASGRSVSSSTISARGSSCGGGSAAGSAAGRPSASPKAITRRPAAVSSSSRVLQLGGRAQRAGADQDVGRADHVGARRAVAVVEGQPAPLPLRGERDLARSTAHGVGGEGVGDRLQRPVALAGGGGEAAERPLRARSRPRRRRRDDLDQLAACRRSACRSCRRRSCRRRRAPRSRSSAGRACSRAPAARAATARVTLISRTRPSGISVIRPAVAVWAASVNSTLRSGEAEQHAGSRAAPAGSSSPRAPG